MIQGPRKQQEDVITRTLRKSRSWGPPHRKSRLWAEQYPQVEARGQERRVDASQVSCQGSERGREGWNEVCREVTILLIHLLLLLPPLGAPSPSCSHLSKCYQSFPSCSDSFCPTKLSLITLCLIKTPKVFGSYWLRCTTVTKAKGS